MDTTAPTVAISQPGERRDQLPATTTITASASDNVGVTKVEFSVDGKLVATDTSAPVLHVAGTPAPATLGAHTLTAKAYDQAGNSATAEPGVRDGHRRDGSDRQHHQARPTGAR